MNAQKQLSNLKMLVMDVDGVLTDGTIYFGTDGEAIKGFNSQDGAGIKYLQRAGLEAAIISGRESQHVTKRGQELGIKYIRQGAKDKLPVFDALLQETGILKEEAAFIGDDLTDIPVMRVCGFSFAPANSAPEVLDISDIRLTRKGGEGAVREAIEIILKAQDLWDEILGRYV